MIARMLWIGIIGMTAPLACRGAMYSTRASDVIGQPDFETDAIPAVASAATLNRPRGVAYDSKFRLYVVDSESHRVLRYSNASSVADRVYGQPNFADTTGRWGPSGFYYPSQVAINSLDQMVVADSGNHRVLVFGNGPDQPATLVLGQPNFFSRDPNRGLAGPRATTLYQPSGIDFDEHDDCYVADFLNHRVLRFRAVDYRAGNATPAAVYGQPDYETAARGQLGHQLYGPNVVAYSPATGLLIADTGNHRVVVYAPGNTTHPYRVLGQPDFESNQSNNGGRSARTLNAPYGIAVDSIEGVLVSDSGNYRVLYYPPGLDEASVVFGQPDFATAVRNRGGLSRTSISQTIGIALARREGILAIADSGANRVLRFPIINTVNADQRVVFPVGGEVAAASSIEVKGALDVWGNMTVLANGAMRLNLTAAGAVNVTESLNVDAAQTSLEITTDALGQGALIEVASYGSHVGTFDQVSVFSTASQDQCSNVQPQYGLSVLVLLVDCGPSSSQATSAGPSSSSVPGNVTVAAQPVQTTTTPHQVDRGLSTAATVGIAVGAAVVLGTGVAVAIALVSKSIRMRSDAAAKLRLKQANADALRAAAALRPDIDP